jgi:hypothetical protein
MMEETRRVWEGWGLQAHHGYLKKKLQRQLGCERENQAKGVPSGRVSVSREPGTRERKDMVYPRRRGT